MRIIVAKDYDAMSSWGASVVAEELRKKPNMVLGLATGGTMLGLYRELIRMHKEEGLDFSKASSFNLDEYVDLEKDHPQSYHSYMRQNLFDHVNISLEKTHVPDGMTNNLEAECQHYEALINASGGIDLQLLGIGNNGHIGFNEPSDCFPYHTREVQLNDSTVNANSRYFDSIDDVPNFAISMGIGTIVQAKKIILLASGKVKANAIKNSICRDPYPAVPASILQFHNDITFVLDEEAASRLPDRIIRQLVEYV